MDGNVNENPLSILFLLSGSFAILSAGGHGRSCHDCGCDHVRARGYPTGLAHYYASGYGYDGHDCDPSAKDSTRKRHASGCGRASANGNGSDRPE